ncbi:MAG: putative toxin-antitoxin system toxin component, PIN family [Candidatus Doudnabacteria bacterium]|nr:putative toxin-antitoxin system toxin component, PIN family [Candidatus Doudnabacteria bacterium]
MKIAADTNVLISMLLWGKSLEQLFTLVNRRQIILCFSPETIDELIRVVNYSNMKKQAQKLKINTDALLDKLLAASAIYYPDTNVNIIKDDPSDNRLLETAYAAQAEYIISGDRHLTQLKQFRNIPIVRPALFLQIFNRKK